MPAFAGPTSSDRATRPIVVRRLDGSVARRDGKRGTSENPPPRRRLRCRQKRPRRHDGAAPEPDAQRRRTFELHFRPGRGSRGRPTPPRYVPRIRLRRPTSAGARAWPLPFRASRRRSRRRDRRSAHLAERRQTSSASSRRDRPRPPYCTGRKREPFSVPSVPPSKSAVCASLDKISSRFLGCQKGTPYSPRAQQAQ